MFVSAGSASTHATSPSASACSSASTSFHSTTRVVSSSGTGGPRLPARATTAPSSQRGERLVDRAVVAPVEDEHLRPAGDEAREPDREAVRVGRGERELPAGGPKRRVSSSPTQSASSLGSISVIPRAACSAIAAHDRRGGVAGHRARVAEAEVDVLDPVDVAEARARRLRREDGEPARPAHHPVHRHAGEQRASERARRARATGDASPRSARAHA